MHLEDYGLIGDMQSAALVGRNGAADWLCLPRFDSASCFSALLGDERHGRWLVAPAGELRATTRRYVELSVRPDYASVVPWVELVWDGMTASAGPDAFRLSTPLELQVDDGTVRAEFEAREGARERLTLTWHLAYEDAPAVEDADSALARTPRQDRAADMAPLAGHRRVRRDDLAQARRRDLGGARPAAALHVLQGHGVGGVRPRGANRGALRVRGAPRPVETDSRRDPPRGVRAGIRPGAQHLHAVLRIGGARRQRPEHPAGGVPARDRRARDRDDRRGLARARSRRLRLTAQTDDGLPGDEGQFLACSFWLVSALAANGRTEEARTLFERLLGLANDLGLLAEEYDVAHGRQVGNFPQAFSHPTLILAARAISAAEADGERAPS